MGIKKIPEEEVCEYPWQFEGLMADARERLIKKLQEGVRDEDLSEEIREAAWLAVDTAGFDDVIQAACSVNKLLLDPPSDDPEIEQMYRNLEFTPAGLIYANVRSYIREWLRNELEGIKREVSPGYELPETTGNPCCPVCGSAVKVIIYGEGIEEYSVFAEDEFTAGDREITAPEGAEVHCEEDTRHQIPKPTAINAVMSLGYMRKDAERWVDNGVRI